MSARAWQSLLIAALTVWLAIFGAICAIGLITGWLHLTT